jgi:hypothetical protein
MGAPLAAHMNPDNKQATLTADSIGYKFALIRVAPGQETSVARQLKQSIYKDNRQQPVAVLKLFGRFDICAIYRTRDYLDGPSKFGPIHGIRGGNKILAFHWLSPDERPGLSVEKAPGEVWALSFFRFNESVVKFAGAEIELILAREWNKHLQPGVTMDVLGTTGWAELLLVLRGSEFKQITESLSSISQQFITLSTGGKQTNTLLPAKTLSILGIDFDLTLRRNRQALKKKLNEPFKRGRGVFPNLSVTCPPAAMGAVQKAGKTHFGAGAEIFGATDFLFQPKRGIWGSFIADVLDFRTKLPGTIYSTSVSILVAPKRLVNVPYKPPRRAPLKMPGAGAVCFTRWGPTLEHRLRNLYFALLNLLQDPLIGSCFDNLRPMAESFLPRLLNSLDPQDDDERSLLYEIVELLAYATEERAHGAFLSLEHLESSLSPTKGGIQRILVAAESIPRKLIARVKKYPWAGFIVAGYHNESFSSHYEILNLPFEYLFRPEQWCGLLHETGHAAFFDKRFYDMDGEEMTNLIHRIVPSASEDDQEFTKWKELAWEIGADMFDLYFCYGKDMDSYLRNVWPFVIGDSRQLSSERFRRYFLIFEFWKHLLVPGKTSFGRFIDIEADISEFRGKLRGLKLEARTEPKANGEARLAFSGMADVAEVFFHRFRQCGGPRQLAVELEKPEMKNAIRSVLAGKPWLHPITAPDTFILGIKQEPHLTLSAKLAAIVSLWHSARQSDD